MYAIDGVCIVRLPIRTSIGQGHAQHIGHGVDIMHEDRPRELLREMARRHVPVEICPTSNRSLRGIDHPLPIYLAGSKKARLQWRLEAELRDFKTFISAGR